MMNFYAANGQLSPTHDADAITEIIIGTINEMDRAQKKYPEWPQDIVQAWAIASEESGEVTKSVNNYHWRQGNDTVEDIRKEVIQTMAMCLRFLLETPEMKP